MNPLRLATQDVAIADLIQEKRLQYETYKPIFWRVATSAGLSDDVGLIVAVPSDDTVD